MVRQSFSIHLIQTEKRSALSIFVVISLILLCNLSIIANSQEECYSNSHGKKFVIAFPENYGNFHTANLYIFVVSFNSIETKVRVSSKHILSSGSNFFEEFSIAPNGYHKIVVPREFEIIGIKRNFKSVEIQSDLDISASVFHSEPFTLDTFLSIPTSNLGTLYVVASSVIIYSHDASLFTVIGIEDDTTVSVLLTSDITFENTSYSRGDVLTLHMSNLEVVQIISNSDLTGTIINSDKPIVVISGNRCGNTPGSYCDVLLEQSTPVTSWGKNHLYSTSGNQSSLSRYRMIAYFNDTRFSINGKEVILRSGENWQMNISGNGLIVTSKPALLMQTLQRVSGVTVDPSIIHIPTENQFARTFGFITPPHEYSNGYSNFVNIIVKANESSTVLLNGNNIKRSISSMHPYLLSENNITGSDYALLVVKLPRSESLYFVTQDLENYFLMSVIVYGYESSVSYGYAAGISLANDQRIITINPFYIRVLGGEELAIILPCLPQDINTRLVKCRFGLTLNTVEGYHLGVNKVGCISSPFSQIGFHTVYVSLNNGTTYPFSGLVYVADQESLLPQISLRHEQNNFAIDFRAEKNTTLTWDKSLFNSNKLTLNLLRIMDPKANYLEWDDATVLDSNVKNSGSMTLNLSHIFSQRTNEIGEKLLTIGTFLLRPANNAFKKVQVYITGIRAVVTNSLQLVGDNTCNKFLSILEKIPTNTIACPCTMNQADADTNFIKSNELIEIFHPETANCYRSIPSVTGSGQQCCYNSNGNINIGTTSSGSADTYSPEGILGKTKHFIYDVLPWWACCKLSSNCDTYYRYRPTDDCTNYQPPRPAWTFGDPHFRTLDGLEYIFNGAGEFTLAISSLYNFTFQGRMEIFNNFQASVYTGFAIQSANDSRIQVQRTISGQTIIYSDDESLVLEQGIYSRYFYEGVSIQIYQDLSQIDVRFITGVLLRIYIFPQSMSFLLQLDDAFQGKVEGLLGNFNGIITDDFMLPNGSLNSVNSTLSEIHYDFGLNWRIKESDSLFTYRFPFNYETYNNVSFVPVLEIPDVDQVSSQVRELCGDSISCLYDATTTGSLSFANETVQFMKIAEEILNKSVKIVSCGYPGPISNGFINGSAFFAHSVIEISCNDGFMLNTTYENKSVLTCGQNGEWSAFIPSCVLVPISSTPTTPTTPTTTTYIQTDPSTISLGNIFESQITIPFYYLLIMIAVIFLAIAALCASVIILIIAITIYKRYKRSKKIDKQNKYFDVIPNVLYEMAH